MISIIIPTLNEEKVIGSTLQMLALLTLPHEVIVSDGRSTDHTPEIARKHGAAVIVYAGAERQTIAQGRNDGARKAAGDVFVFIDADCVIRDPDEFFARALARFAAEPRLTALAPMIRVLPDQETWGDWLVFGAVNLGLRLENNVLGRGEALGELQMIRRDAFVRLGGYREDLVTREDADMFRRLAGIGKVMLDPDLTVYHTGRRAHRIGWPRMILTWIMNTVSVRVRGAAHTNPASSASRCWRSALPPIFLRPCTRPRPRAIRSPTSCLIISASMP